MVVQLMVFVRQIFFKSEQNASLFIRKIDSVFVANGKILSSEEIRILKNIYLIQYIIYLKDS